MTAAIIASTSHAALVWLPKKRLARCFFAGAFFSRMIAKTTSDTSTAVAKKSSTKASQLL